MFHPDPHLRLGGVAPAIKQSHRPVPTSDSAHSQTRTVVRSQALVVVYYEAVVIESVPVVVLLVVLVADAGEGGVDASNRAVCAWKYKTLMERANQ